MRITLNNVAGKLAVAIPSLGPAATNTLTGLTTAFADSIPFLLITGGAHTYMENRGILQELDRRLLESLPR